MLMNEIGFIQTIGEKLKEQQIKLWHKCKRSLANYLQHETYVNWLKYIKANDMNCIDKHGNLILNEAKFYRVSNSPLSRCYKVVQTLYKPYQKLLGKKKPSVMKAPPTYKITFLKNLFYIENENDIENSSIRDNCYDFWTDCLFK